MIEYLLEALTLGFLYGIGPCTISCAPLIVPLIMSTAKNKKQGVAYSIIFGVGRVISYSILGFSAGLLGKTIENIMTKKILGGFLIILGVFLLFNIHNKCIYRSKIKINGSFMSLTAGIVYGFGPCPPLIALLGLAVLSGSALTGFLMAIIFGIGTILSPLIFLGIFSAWFANKKEIREVVPYVSGIFLILVGLVYLLT